MEIKDLGNLFFAISFLVPGFILHEMMSLFVPDKHDKTPRLVLRFLTYSCFNYGVWSWLIWLMFTTQFFASSQVCSAAAWFLIIFVGPLFMGVLVGYHLQKETITNFLRRKGLRVLQFSYPTAWEFKFAHIETGVWIRVTFKDGSRVVGWYDSLSAASGERAERDIYVQEIWAEKGNKRWTKVSNTDGMIIRADEIRHIEFLKDEEVTSD